jgi:hypothetical protein
MVNARDVKNTPGKPTPTNLTWRHRLLGASGTVSMPLHADGSVISYRCHRNHRASGGRAAGRADHAHLGLSTATPSGYQPGLRVVDRLAAAGMVQRASARIFIPQRFGVKSSASATNRSVSAGDDKVGHVGYWLVTEGGVNLVRGRVCLVGE